MGKELAELRQDLKQGYDPGMTEDQVDARNARLNQQMDSLSEAYDKLHAKYMQLVSFTDEERDRTIGRIVSDLKDMGQPAGFERATRMYNQDFFQQQEDRTFARQLAEALLNHFGPSGAYRVWERAAE